MNEIGGKSVTPENNAAVLLFGAVGPAQLTADRAEYFPLLGIQVPAEKGDYFVEPEAFVRQRSSAKQAYSRSLNAELRKFAAEWEIATKRAWSAKTFPLLASWLEANEKPLNLAAKASLRPKFFDPLIVHEDNLLFAAPVHLARFERDLATALVERATLQLGNGRTAPAWQDLLAAHRLARLCGQGPTLAEALLSGNIDKIRCDGDEALIRHASLSAAEALRPYETIWQRCRRLPSTAEKIDREERFGFLECVIYSASSGSSSWAAKYFGRKEES